ncbi:zinc finger protein 518B [Hemicordylus capensis]|uniref:zinc finger protein 518B n=1 Tax=Hemicordylus capensis TaxID=884348 RepID=UPI0023029329|nr:zinc finger protein 518B [Hemicordylus capensis]XP_053111517.1 zinc finger protein 518B [Hemicordylus capensis]XP_053111518.1 zinc finger protein 518B [Hemicordylus capensis]
MQLKKMREIIPTVYASKASKGYSSLTASPKQASVDKAISTKASDGNQKTEEIKSHLIRCIKCRCGQETSMVELQKLKCQQGEDTHSMCSKCVLSVPSIVNFVTDHSVYNMENSKKTTSFKTLRTFKVKNFQPDKYYCDKCRFSTKDPLQHKRHIAQHEEIRFVCSYCSCVSYTKGEFQRHLVKHTGTFPYQCKYCDYGAVRHDYVVKHTRRLHGTVADKQVKLSVAKAVQKRNCLPKQCTEKIRLAQEGPLQNESSNTSLNMGINEMQDEILEVACSSGDAANRRGAACMQDKNILEPSDVRNENAVVEVEVYSPQKGPVMPEMPLTVVAPATFVAPPNCLAEIIDIKKVNGVQQLILKLIPLGETASRLAKSKQAESANWCTEQELTIDGHMLPTLDESCVLDKYYMNAECPSSSISTTLNCSLKSQYRENVICKENAERENNFISTAGEISPDEIKCPESFQREKCAKNRHGNSNLDAPRCLSSTFSEDKNEPPNGGLDSIQKNNSILPSVCDTKCLTLSDTEREHMDELTATKARLFDSNLSYPSESTEELQQNKTANVDSSRNVLEARNVNRKNTKCKEDNACTDSLELQNVKNEDSSLEGPVISSVFSLSSGAVNIPEGIKWDDTSHKKRSTSLLCRKIAQLMAAAESSTKSQLAASLRHGKNNASKEKMLSSSETSGKHERNGLATASEQESVPSPVRPNYTNPPNEHSSKQEQMQPSEIPRATTKTRVTNTMHVVSPVFIPQGTVLRVLERTSTEGPTGEEKRDQMLLSPHCNKFLPRPVPCCASAKLGQDPSSLPTENNVDETFRNQNAQMDRTKGQYIMKSSCQQNRALPYPKGNVLHKPNKGVMKGEETKNKGKQLTAKGDSSKKRSNPQEDCFLKIVPILARHLRLIPFKNDQLIKCPHRNQPVVVLNHPDVDSPEIINVMKVINRYKGNVLKAVLSERTISCLGVKRYHKRLTFQNFEKATQIKKLDTLKMKLKKINKNNYKVVNSSLEEASKQTFKCWFCGRMYVDQEEWISHGQKHFMEATRGWEVLSFSLESDK